MKNETTEDVEKTEDVNKQVADASKENETSEEVGGEIPPDDDEEGQPPA